MFYNALEILGILLGSQVDLPERSTMSYLELC